MYKDIFSVVALTLAIYSINMVPFLLLIQKPILDPLSIATLHHIFPKGLVCVSGPIAGDLTDRIEFQKIKLYSAKPLHFGWYSILPKKTITHGQYALVLGIPKDKQGKYYIDVLLCLACDAKALTKYLASRLLRSLVIGGGIYLCLFYIR